MGQFSSSRVENLGRGSACLFNNDATACTWHCALRKESTGHYYSNQLEMNAVATGKSATYNFTYERDGMSMMSEITDDG